MPFLGRMFTKYTKISLLSTWLLLTNAIKPRLCTKSRNRLFIPVLFLSLWRQSAVLSELSVKLGPGHWQTLRTQIRSRRTRRLIRVCTVCLNQWKLRVKWNTLKSPFSLHSETIDPLVLSVLWLDKTVYIILSFHSKSICCGFSWEALCIYASNVHVQHRWRKEKIVEFIFYLKLYKHVIFASHKESKEDSVSLSSLKQDHAMRQKLTYSVYRGADFK